MYSLRVLIYLFTLLVLAQTTLVRRSITNSASNQNTTTVSSSLSTPTKTAAQIKALGEKPADEGLKPANETLAIDTRRKITRSRSTSSSSGEKTKSGTDSDEKEDIDSTTSAESTESREDDKGPKANNELKGWRRWHRKCTPCPEEMKLKWRDPSISWICGGYQRARRSFKSSCMMYYRNCQDGTMFVKIHDHRCADDDKSNNTVALRHGDHFFYDYKVIFSGDDSTEQDKAETSSDSESD